jgi:hypothetical protein
MELYRPYSFGLGGGFTDNCHVTIKELLTQKISIVCGMSEWLFGMKCTVFINVNGMRK